MSLCARDRSSTGIAPSRPPPLQSNSPRHDVRECPRARLPEPHNRFAPFAPSFRLYLISLKADQWRRAHRSPSGRISISTTTNRIGRCATTVGCRERAGWDKRMGTSEWGQANGTMSHVPGHFFWSTHGAPAPHTGHRYPTRARTKREHAPDEPARCGSIGRARGASGRSGSNDTRTLTHV